MELLPINILTPILKDSEIAVPNLGDALINSGANSGANSGVTASGLVANVQTPKKVKVVKKPNLLDELTGLANKTYFQQAFEVLWLEQQKQKGCLSMILCDIDYLESYNESFGYQKGNRCLQDIALVLKEAMPTKKTTHSTKYLLARYGADCFVVLLSNMYIDDTLSITEKMLQSIRALRLPHPNSKVDTVVTASFGIASAFPRPQYAKESLFSNAKEALLQAKMQGRNAAYTLPPAWSQSCTTSSQSEWSQKEQHSYTNTAFRS